MIETSVYGAIKSLNILKNFASKTEKFQRIERVFYNSENSFSKRLWLFQENKELKLISRSAFDRNRQRIGITFTITETKVKDNHKEIGEFLKSNGFEETKMNIAEGVRFSHNGYIVEATKFKEASDFIDSSEEEHFGEIGNLDDDGVSTKIYFVKAFTVQNTVEECEKRLQNAFLDLEDFVALKKPDLSLFE